MGRQDSLADHVHRHEELRHALGRLMNGALAPRVGGAPGAAPRAVVDVVVTPNEMNDRHGTGVLVKRVFGERPGVVSVRARDDYGGEHDFGERAIVLPQKGFSRADAYRRVLEAFEGCDVRRVACIPFTSDDLVTSIALHDAFGAPVAMWIMDDQNVACPVIPDALMREALEKCSLRLATHPELRQAYEKKYRLRFDLLPAVIPGALVKDDAGADVGDGTGALIGTLWSRTWFDRLCETLSRSGHAVDWFGNHQSPYLQITQQKLDAAGIRAHGIVSETVLARELRARSFAIVPTGMVEDDVGTSRALAELSLPGRILFAAAAANTPVVVLGSAETPAARFVRRFDIGVCVPYDAEALHAAVEEIVKPEVQRRMRRCAASIARTFSGDGIGEWVWRSVEQGEPADDRFERIMPRVEGDLTTFVEPAVAAEVYRAPERKDAC